MLTNVVSELTNANPVRFEIKPASAYAAGALFLIHAYGLSLALPVLAAVVLMSLVPLGVAGSLLLPVAATLATVWFLPFGLGNSYVSRLVRRVSPQAAAAQQGFIVQVTFTPRLRSGLRAMAEDADDIGFLFFTPSALCFHGDSVRLEVAYSRLTQVHPQNVGLRGLFVYGRRLEVLVKGVQGLEAMQFTERASFMLSGSRRITRQLREQLSARLGAV